MNSYILSIYDYKFVGCALIKYVNLDSRPYEYLCEMQHLQCLIVLTVEKYHEPTAAIWMPMEEVVEQTTRRCGIHGTAGRNANGGCSTTGTYFMGYYLIMMNTCRET